MNMKNYLVAVAIIAIGVLGCTQTKQYPTEKKKNLTDYINPFIGTSRGGNQQPGARLPFGMVHFSPVNKQEYIDPKATNYVFGEPEIFGFSLVNISGVGCSSYGGISIMPGMGVVDLKNKKTEYSNEEATPGYYSVILTKHNIKTELTSTQRCGYARFTFPKGEANVTIDLSRRELESKGFYIEKNSDTEFSGYKQDGEFCGRKGEHTIYLYAKLKNTPVKSGLLIDNKISDKKTASGEELAFYAKYESEKEQQVEIVCGISYVSIENAKENLETEIGDASFMDIRKKAVVAWQEKLSRILVEGGTDKDKTKFYTAIYHTMSHPNIINDVNGEYPAMKTFETKQKAPGEDRYSLFSLWDTYRNLHSFFALAYPEIQSDMVQSMLDMYEEGGWLPHWELISVEKGVMNGDPAPVVIADSYLRGIRDFDVEKAYEAMLHNAEHLDAIEEIRRDNKNYLDHNGYLVQDNERVWGVVATTQEYNFSDWNIAQMAKAMGKDNDYERFMKRSEGYRYFWDSETQFFRARYADGRFFTPFDEFEISGENSWFGSGGPGYCEGNAWHYLYFVPHDMQYLRDSIMGTELFVEKLQTMFDSSYY